MKTYFITENNFNNWQESLADKYKVYAPYSSDNKIPLQQTRPQDGQASEYFTTSGSNRASTSAENRTELQRRGNCSINLFNKDKNLLFNPYRVSTPFIKTIMFQAEERVVPLPENQKIRNIVFGIKGCDMASIPILDYVFNNGDFQDPLYIANRENTVLISSDCSDLLETCFCTLVGYKPYPEKNFDINMSLIRDGYILTVATEKGENILDIKLLENPTDNQLKMVDINRKNVFDKIKAQVSKQGYDVIASPQRAVMDNFESPVWDETAKTCVECGACNFSCPTCHCFLLYDREQSRYRCWDACQYYGFALVAGGANPRKKLHQRVRNRYVKKFDYFQKHIKLSACVGCGRCIRACIGLIDIREVVKRLVVDKQIS